MMEVNQINTWGLYSKDGRCALIPDDEDNSPLGMVKQVNPNSSWPLEVYSAILPNGIGFIAFKVNYTVGGAWALAAPERIQFQE